jgi:hypothetical protein
VGAAGHSAGEEARRRKAQAEEHQRLAAQLRQEAERWMLASRTERQVAGSLAPLSAVGYTFLHDRRWPGSRNAQIDHVLVGRGGLFIVDTKAWRDVTVAAGRIFRGQEDVTDDLADLADVGYGAEAVMAELGLSPNAVRVVVVLAGSNVPATEVASVTVVGERRAAAHINSYGHRVTESEADQILGLAREHFAVLTPRPTLPDTAILPPVLPEPEPEPLLTVDDIADVLIADALAEPIESWMTFLHPDQAKLVRRSFAGPSRIRGAAGTGKTVVGLHRAAYLARSQSKRVLVTSFVKTLPDVLSQLMLRLAPEVADRVEFTGVHAFALRLLGDRGIRTNVRPADADLVFDAVWREHGLETLGKIDHDPRYWRDEISKVIKGRGLSSFDEYAELTRTGRRRGLTLDQRRQVWKLYVEYSKGLTDRGITDFDDIVLLAEASLREHPLDTYGAVIIDEAQDLTCAMVRMLHQLVGDTTDGLTVIGDGQQSIYPGGFTLAEAGVLISGRAVVMTTNYRNTRQIVEFAVRAVEGDAFADIEGAIEARDAVADIPRTGQHPTMERFRTRGQHDQALLARLRAVQCSLADVGILSLTSYGVKETRRVLESAGIPTIDLADYRGVPVDAVKIGTVKRAKGLEFKTVLMPRVRPDWIDVADRDDEAHVIHRRELYVGMTRARDELWVGVCA